MSYWPRYKIDKRFSLNSLGQPTTDYMVQKKTGVFSKWQDVIQKTNKLDAMIAMDALRDGREP